jgi:hypothetical protein
LIVDLVRAFLEALVAMALVAVLLLLPLGAGLLLKWLW